MSIRLAQHHIDPPVLLAPMAGITDLPFRRIVAGFGAGLLVSEMVASGEMLTARPSVRAKARIDLGLEDGTGRALATSVQLAGREAEPMAEAARMLEDLGAPIIDINMGCPAKKVTGGLSGSALMRDPDHALRLIEAVAGAVSVPVTLKMRLGWDEAGLNAPQIAARAEAAGIRMITVHGRTRVQFYKGWADWPAIAATVGAVSLPVVANGDVTGPESARAALAASGAAGVMIGRGAQGAPWKLAEISHALHGTPAPEIPYGAARGALVLAHHEGILSFYGTELGMRIARKHLGWYADAAGVAAPERAAMLVTTGPKEIRALIATAFAATDAGTARESASPVTAAREAAAGRDEAEENGERTAA